MTSIIPDGHANGHQRVEVTLLQIHPVHRDARISDRTRRFTLDDATPNIVLGRASRNRDLIPARSNLWLESPIVTKEHARFIRGTSITQPLLIRDLNSTHGTYVSGIKIHSDTIVQDGDMIKFGEHITNGPLQFDPPTFLVEFQVLPALSHPPTPDHSSPQSALTSASLNHFGAPDDCQSDVHSASVRAVGSDMMSALEPAAAIMFEEEDPADFSSDIEDDDSVAEAQSTSRPFSIQAPSGNTSESSESNSDSDDDISIGEDKAEEVSSSSLPPTRQSPLSQSSTDALDLSSPCQPDPPTTRGAEMKRPELTEVKKFVANSASFSWGAGLTVPSPTPSPAPISSELRGSSQNHPIVLDSYEPQEMQRLLMQEDLSTDSYRPRSPQFESYAIPPPPSAYPIYLGTQRTRQPSPSDAALARPQLNSVMGPMPNQQSYQGQTVSEMPTAFISNHQYNNVDDGELNVSPLHRSSVYTDGPFKAPAESAPEPNVANSRSRSSGLAIEELIHHSGSGSPSLKRTRDESDLDEEDASDRDAADEPPSTTQAVRSTSDSLKSVLERTQPIRMASMRPWTGRNPVFYEGDLTTDDELDQDAFDYDREFADAVNRDVDVDSVLMQPPQSPAGIADYEEQLRLLEQHSRRRVLLARRSEFQKTFPLSGDRLHASAGLNEACPAEDQVSAPVTTLNQDGLDLPEVAQPETNVRESLSPQSCAAPRPRESDISFGCALSPEVVSLSHSITAAGQRASTGKDTTVNKDATQPHKKVKVSHSRKPRFGRFMKKAVPFMAGAVATAATIFAGAGMLISTMHEELRHEALVDLGL